ncbi:DoxX family protein [Hymenobacter chitinivorans]|uniref:DoxX-like protein n=1 Tax=Hymenobacter chitinivorans DSM 11115 TaxID=1121954 RepID=A0A2M9ASC0_9BACT|nr:DoxX family protein [Hymenobacter chitinivorans]PJJ48533.1 DoxX-like protein [Hymenobacter chitinivorans DSM 11115]
MKTTNILYWISTGLLCALMLLSGISNALSVPEAVEGFKQLGYPAYLLPFLGVAKLLGVLALLVPGFPRLREWAYAGFVFDLAGALYSGLAIGAPLSQWLPILVFFLVIAVSYRTNQRRAAAPAEPKTQLSVA